MCFIIKGFNQTKPKPKIAKEDIIVYKTLYYSQMERKYKSPFYDFYCVGKLVKIEKFGFRSILNSYSNKVWIIDDGLHAYLSIEKAQNFMCSDEKIFAFKIPKGTKYYENDCEIVSLAMKRISKKAVKLNFESIDQIVYE